MQTLTRLLEHQGSLLREIQNAARKQDAAAVLALQKKLEMLASLIRQQDEINRSVATFERGLAAGSEAQSTTTESHTCDGGKEISAKERGRRQRENFVHMLSSRGIALHRLKGAVFRSPRGIRVGIAYARESQKDKWFLGLAENQFEYAVLICEQRAGEVIHFSLPKEFMSEHGESLSRKDGQIKFNVFKRDGQFFLHLPRLGSASIEAFRDKFSGLI